MGKGKNHRVLIVDDNESIHEDFRKTFALLGQNKSDFGNRAEFILSGTTAPSEEKLAQQYELDFAHQGEEALAKVQSSLTKDHHYSLAFVDVRMPPGWDGIKTIEEIWKVDPRIEVVICTAYSDQSWDDIQARLGLSDKLLILKKPFETVEILQHTVACCRKWDLEREHELQIKVLMEEATWEKTRAEAIVLNSPDSIIIVDEKLMMTYLNRPLNFAHAKVEIGQKISDIFGPDHAEQINEVAKRIFNNGPSEHFDLTWELKGSVVDAYRVRVGPIRANNHITALVFVITDIRESKTLESQFLRAQRIESVGRLAGGLAHDFNNLLTVQLAVTSMLMEDTKLDDEVKKSIGMIKEMAERAAGITSQLLSFSNNQPIIREQILLKDFLDHIQELATKSIGESVKLSIKIADPLLSIEGSKRQLEQVLFNLVLSARDSMASGGVLLIEASTVTLDKPIVGDRDTIEPGKYTVLSVSDTGEGMPKGVIDQIFDPFFTTKEFGKGSGMGLSMVHGIMKAHCGYVHVYSEPGLGTTFRLFFPDALSLPAIESKKPTGIDHARLFGSERILLVEDNENIRDCLRDNLKSFGYDVQVAKNGADALQTLANTEKNGDKIEVIVSDIVMPEMNGPDFIDVVRKNDPDVKVIFISGYSNESLERLGNPNGQSKEAVFIQKPFLVDELIAKIRELLREAP